MIAPRAWIRTHERLHQAVHATWCRAARLSFDKRRGSVSSPGRTQGPPPGPPGPPSPRGTLHAASPQGKIVGPEPDGSVIVLFGIGANGGTLPYTFTYVWADGFVDIKHVPPDIAFTTRTFPTMGVAVRSCKVTIESADGQKVGPVPISA